MAWDGPILTGQRRVSSFFAFKLRKINDEGVQFCSHIDGSLHKLTPEYAIEIQNALGADIIMAFDECASYGADYDEAKKTPTNARLTGYARYNTHQNPAQALFLHSSRQYVEDLRKASILETLPCAKHGLAIGGNLAWASLLRVMYKMLDVLRPIIPSVCQDTYGRGRRLYFGRRHKGNESFDCVLPTRIAQTERLTAHRARNHTNSQYKEDFSPMKKTATVTLQKLLKGVYKAFGQCQRDFGRKTFEHP